MTAKTQLGSAFEDALVFATRLHAKQRRKGGVPYAAHLLAVTSIVLDDGGDEEQAIAALLHDAVEDQGGLPRLEEIRERFGERVARIVDGCTDSYDSPRHPWLERKIAYLEKLPEVKPDVYRVSCADKLHNSRTLLRDLRESGDEVWKRYHGGRKGSIWYYRTLADFFLDRFEGPLSAELDRVVSSIEQLVGWNGARDWDPREEHGEGTDSS